MKLLIQLAVVSTVFALTACSENHDHDDHAGHTHASPEQAVPAAELPPAQVQDGISVRGAWVRPTVGEQDATGAYLNITSQENLALVGVTSHAAEIAEVHEMKMDGDIMRMRKVDRIELKAGEALELKPGGYHVMLMALTAPVQADHEIEASLLFEKPDGSKITMPVKFAAGQNAGDEPHGQHDHGKEHKH